MRREMLTLQENQSRRHEGFGGISLPKQSSKPPNWNMKCF